MDGCDTFGFLEFGRMFWGSYTRSFRISGFRALQRLRAREWRRSLGGWISLFLWFFGLRFCYGL